jgi:hypothetical protein
MRALLCILFSLALAAPLPAHAFWGVLGKLGSSAGKTGAATAGKTGAAAGTAGVVGVEAEAAAAAAAKAAKSADNLHPNGAPATAEQISAQSGLGKAVPAEVEAMLYGGGGRTLKSVPDAGVRDWLQMPYRASAASPKATEMMHDYVRLLEGKPAMGPKPTNTSAKVPEPLLPHTKPARDVPWYAIELVLRAAHMGHIGAQREVDRLCREHGKSSAPLPPHCKPNPAAVAKSK